MLWCRFLWVVGTAVKVMVYSEVPAIRGDCRALVYGCSTHFGGKDDCGGGGLGWFVLH